MEEIGHMGKSAALCYSKNCRMEEKGVSLYQESRFTDATAGCNVKVQPGQICVWIDQPLQMKLT